MPFRWVDDGEGGLVCEVGGFRLSLSWTSSTLVGAVRRLGAPGGTLYRPRICAFSAGAERAAIEELRRELEAVVRRAAGV